MNAKTILIFSAAVACAALFFAEGYVFVRQLGAQEDEVLFASPLLRPFEATAWVAVAGKQVPLMILPYAGALKSIVYKPILKAWPPDVRVLRVPMLLLGTATVFLFFLYFRLVLGNAGGLAAMALLVTEASFVVTTVLDWGILAVQHFLAAVALLLFVVFHRTGKRLYLGAALFACGVAMWDKVTFVWVLAGWLAGAIVAYGPEMAGHLRRHVVRLSIGCLVLGALPLIYYNVKDTAGTFRESGGMELPKAFKISVLWKTLDGSALFGYFSPSSVPPKPRTPATDVEDTAVWLSEITGEQEHHGLLAACLASIVVMFFLKGGPERKLMKFCLVAFAVGWAAMLPFSMGGKGSHHVLLLWPLPQMLVAAALIGLARRYGRQAILALAIACLLAAGGVLVTNEYYAQIVTRGTTDHWSDAVFFLRELMARTPAKGIYPVDWGIMGPLRFLGRGTLQLQFTHYLQNPGPESSQESFQIQSIARDPHNYFVYYWERSQHPNEGLSRLRKATAEAGLRESVYARIPDRLGRTVFIVSRFVPASEGQ